MAKTYFIKLLKQTITQFYISDANTCIEISTDSPILQWAALEVVKGSITLSQLLYEDNTLIINI